MKLSRTPVFIDLDRPRRIVFNMHVRKQLEELRDAGKLNVEEIFQERDGQRTMNWKMAMLFVTVALQEDAIERGETLDVETVERHIDSLPEAVEVAAAVFSEYGKFLGVAAGEAAPAVAKGPESDAGAESGTGRAKKPSSLSAGNTESLPASSGD